MHEDTVAIIRIGGAVILGCAVLDLDEVPDDADVMVSFHASPDFPLRLRNALAKYQTQVYIAGELRTPLFEIDAVRKLVHMIAKVKLDDRCLFCEGALSKYMVPVTERRSVLLCYGAQPAKGAETGATKRWGYSYEDLAVMFDVSQRTIKKWVNRKDDPLDPADPVCLRKWIIDRCVKVPNLSP